MRHPDDPANPIAQVAELTARCAELENRLAQLGRINASLMDRVERDMDAQGNSFSIFQGAIALESQVKERTIALQQALHRLEQTNSELHASNLAAQQASRAKSAFLAAMSHELRTPMNGVIGMTEILLNTHLDEYQQRSTRTIRHSALSLLRILNDILDFSKIEAGQMQTEEAPFDLRQTFDSSLSILKPQLDKKGLELRLDWPAELPVAVLGDSIRFAQILTNLLGNAIKFTAQGFIAVRVQTMTVDAASIEYRFEITDSGIGIKPEAIARLFNPFTQADSSTTRQFGGTGLGLVIVRRLCTLMGGECGVQSEYGHGSCFWFTLKLKPNLLPDITQLLPADQLSAPLPTHAQHLQPLEILLVEDNFINQEVATALLEMLHCRCTVADNGQCAVDILRESSHFDLVLMDCQMPVMDGFEATHQIRSSESDSGRHTPIIALTANAMVGDRETCLASGMDDFMSKPFQLHELATMLRKWCPVNDLPDEFEEQQA
ncbi:MAG: ATP-binding protein [Steroidobacteraceae bacterium]